MNKVKFFFTGESLFAAFLFSSVFKGFFNYGFIDLTLLFMLITMAIALLRLFKDPKINKSFVIPIIIYTMIATLMLVSFLYTPSVIYSQDKFLKFITITAWSFLGVFILIKDQKSLERFLKGLLVFGSATCLLVFYDYIITGDDFSRIGIGDNQGNILGLARLAGITSLTILTLYFYESKTKLKDKVIPLALLSISMFILLLTGGRMPLLTVLIATAVLIILSFNYDFKTKGIVISKRIFGLLSLSPLVFIISIFLYQKGFFNSMIYRMRVLMDSDGGGASVQARTSMYDASIEIWKNYPMKGIGVGGFPSYYGADGRMYPHNIFLEILSELGLMGIILISLLFVFTLISFFSARKVGLNSVQILVTMILVFLIFNASASGDINDNRWLFTFLALVSVLPSYNKKEGNVTSLNETQLEQTTN